MAADTVVAVSDRSLRDPRVALFLVAEAVSAIGSFATFIAIWGYAVYEFDASPLDVTGFAVAFSLPAVLVGPMAGSAVDRHGPRRVLVGAKVVGALASLALIGAGDFRTLVLLSACHGAVGAFALPALQALPPRIVRDEDLARTNALVSLADELAIVVGPVVGGVAIGVAGFRAAFVFDALTYLVGVAALPLVRIRDIPRDQARTAPSIVTAVRELVVVTQEPVVRRVILAGASVNLLYGAAILAEPLYVRDVLERSPATFAALQSVFGVALVGSGLVVARLGDRVARFPWVAGGVGAAGASSMVYLGTPWIVAAFGGVAVWGFVTAFSSGPTRTLLQRATSEEWHGRVLAADFVAASGAQLVGTVVSGALMAVIGVQATILLVGSVVVFVAATLARVDVRSRSRDHAVDEIVVPFGTAEAQ